jgi:hypothetical protein
MNWSPLATEGTDTYTMDWSKRLDTGVTLSSVAYEADPTNGLTFTSNSVASNVSSIAITANTVEEQYWIKLTPTLSSGSISPVSVRLKVVKHIPAR